MMAWWFALGAAWGAEGVQLTLQEAIEDAWTHTAGAQVIEARIAEAEAERWQGIGDPQFRVRLGDVGSNTDPLETTLQVRQDVEDLISGGVDHRARRQEAEVQQAELELLREQVRLQTVELFDRVRLLAAELALHDEAITLAEERVAVLEKRAEAGLQVAKDAVDAAIELAELRGDRAETAFALTSAKAELLASMGRDPALPVELVGPGLRETVEASLTSRTSHLEARVAAAELQAAVLERKAEAAAKMPFLDWVEARVQLQRGSVPSWDVGFAVNLPLFTAFDGAVRVAKQGIAVREAEERRLEAEHDIEIRRERVRLDAARAALKALDTQRKAAEEALERYADKLTPDELLAFKVGLADERRQELDIIEEGLEARRMIEASGG